LINPPKHTSRIFFLSLCLIISGVAFSQDTTGALRDTTQSVKDTPKKMIPADSIPKVAKQLTYVDKVDSVLKHHSPKKAAIRSAILPGLGQIYNKKYWKLPIIYGALGISGAVFQYNMKWYKKTRYAYKVLFNNDTASFVKVDPLLQPLLTSGNVNRLRTYRDGFRQDIDYSVLATLVLWGLNVVDATVDAHLKPFDVSDELSLKLKIGPSEMARTTGVSLVLAFK
jgi:hypothetical protein